MTEGEFVRKLLKELNGRLSVKAVKLNTGPYGHRGEPDIIGSYCGKFFAIEVKLEYNKPTELQLKRLDEWDRTGAIAVVMTHYPGINVKDTITHFLQTVRDGRGKQYEQGKVY